MIAEANGTTSNTGDILTFFGFILPMIVVLWGIVIFSGYAAYKIIKGDW